MSTTSTNILCQTQTFKYIFYTQQAWIFWYNATLQQLTTDKWNKTFRMSQIMLKMDGQYFSFGGSGVN